MNSGGVPRCEHSLVLPGFFVHRETVQTLDATKVTSQGVGVNRNDGSISEGRGSPIPQPAGDGQFIL